jgi:hypothetical protein
MSKSVLEIEVTETQGKQFVSFFTHGIWDFNEVPIEENVNQPSQDTGGSSE